MLHKIKEERNILHMIKRGKTEVYWSHLAYELPLKHVIEGKIEGRRRRRRYKHLLDDFKEKRRQWKLKEEILDRPITRLGRGYGPVIRCDYIHCVYRWST